ncbi:MAG: hypothetical protein ACAH11_05085 [Sphingomonas sp.]
MRRAGGFALLLLAGCGQFAEPVFTDNAEIPANVAVAAAAPSPAPSPTPRAVCAEYKPIDRAEHGMFLEKPLPIPAKFADVASASTSVMTVQALSGAPVCVTLDWISEASEFELSADKRFLQFDHQGYEAFGHRVVDRVGRTDIETGESPLFSKDGRYFAAVQVSPSGFGGLEGIAIWEVGPKGVTQLGKVETGAVEGDWTVEGFGPGPCVALSVQADPLSDGSGQTPVPVQRFSLIKRDGKWRLTDAKACAATDQVNRRPAAPAREDRSPG